MVALPVITPAVIPVQSRDCMDKNGAVISVPDNNNNNILYLMRVARDSYIIIEILLFYTLAILNYNINPSVLDYIEYYRLS